ncbi:MAG: chemotaxis response regulator protein-glutamate methylesterase [Planctomycetes bacterium]|nr:chemotaxis response regulator protein-glutamate methylesterase [Planctomycetota bacterium]
MRKARILIVDDDVISRKLLRTMLEKEQAAEIVGLASNGKIALQKIAQLNPDLVTLDVEMPEMDGIETLKRIRRQWPALPVVMFSGSTEEGAEVTLEALSLGASDYVTKPQGRLGSTLPLEQLKADFLPKIRALCKVDDAPDAKPKRPRAPLPRSGRKGPTPTLLAIGVSTGGPNALAEVIPGLAPDLPVPVVIVQHMPPMFTRLLAERLDKSAPLAVHECKGGERLEPGHVYIAPGDFHMRVVACDGGPTLQLDQGPPVNSCRPAVDPLFESAVAVYGEGVLGVVLTGMGQDGLVGCEHVRHAGGSVVVQDEATSVVWGMPGFVARNGLADAVLPLAEIAGELNQRLSRDGNTLRTPRAQAS